MPRMNLQNPPQNCLGYRYLAFTLALFCERHRLWQAQMLRLIFGGRYDGFDWQRRNTRRLRGFVVHSAIVPNDLEQGRDVFFEAPPAVHR